MPFQKILVTSVAFLHGSCKGAWKKFFMLWLLGMGFNTGDVGVIISSSAMVKTVSQIFFPLFANYLTAQGFVPRYTYMTTITICLLGSVAAIHWIQISASDHSLSAMVLRKNINSLASGGLTTLDGFIMHQCKMLQMNYSIIQTATSTAFLATTVCVGMLIDRYGNDILFDWMYVSRLTTVVLVVWITLSSSDSASIQIDKSDIWKIWRESSQVSEIATWAFSSMIMGVFFVVLESITIVQMSVEFNMTQESIGWSMLIVLAGEIMAIYVVDRLIMKSGHTTVLIMGHWTAIVFLVLSCFIDRSNQTFSIWIAFIRGVAYAVVTCTELDLLIKTCPVHVLSSVQAFRTICWFTIGTSIGHFAWFRFYGNFGALSTYAICGLSLFLYSVAFNYKWYYRYVTLRHSTAIIFGLALMAHYLHLSGFHTDEWWTRRRVFAEIDDPSQFKDTMRVNHTMQANHTIRKGKVHQALLYEANHTIRKGKVHHDLLQSTQNKSHRKKSHRKTTYKGGGNVNKINATHRTFSQWVTRRMQLVKPETYAKYADRLWMSQWSKIPKCGAKVPAVLAFFTPNNISLLDHFVAPASGAVVKLNHWAGHVVVLMANTSLTLSELAIFKQKIRLNYSTTSEKHYFFSRKGVIIEEFLPGISRNKRPWDLKAYAFNGVIPMMDIHVNRTCHHKRQKEYECFFESIVLDPVKYELLPFNHKTRYVKPIRALPPKPCNWDTLMRVLECLSSGINFAR